MSNSSLCYANALHWEEGVRAFDVELNTSGAFALGSAKVGVGVQVEVEFGDVISDPSYLSVVQGALNVLHQFHQTFVVLTGPFGYVSRQVRHGTQQVESCKPCCVEDLH